MVKKTKESKNQGLIVGLCAAIIAIIVIVVVIIVVMMNKNNGLTGLSDSYFVSDGSKYVIEMDGNDIYVEDEMPLPTKYYLVYTYSGDNITGLKAYYLYENEETAKTAQNYVLENNSSYYDSIDIDGRYLILTIPAADYEGITTSDVEQQIEIIESMKQIDSGEEIEDITENEETVEETTGE